jgi:hypothetical protein
LCGSALSALSGATRRCSSTKSTSPLEIIASVGAVRALRIQSGEGSPGSMVSKVRLTSRNSSAAPSTPLAAPKPSPSSRSIGPMIDALVPALNLPPMTRTRMKATRKIATSASMAPRRVEEPHRDDAGHPGEQRDDLADKAARQPGERRQHDDQADDNVKGGKGVHIPAL